MKGLDHRFRMSDPRVKTYETYLSAWSKIPDEERARLLRESLSESIVLTHPMGTRRGLADVAEHLQGFQQRSPGGSLSVTNADTCRCPRAQVSIRCACPLDPDDAPNAVPVSHPRNYWYSYAARSLGACHSFA